MTLTGFSFYFTTKLTGSSIKSYERIRRFKLLQTMLNSHNELKIYLTNNFQSNNKKISQSEIKKSFI